MTALRLTLRAHRFEFVAVAIFTAVVLAGSAAVLLRLMAFDVPLECFVAGSADPACVTGVDEYFSFLGAVGVFPAAGVVLLPVVAGLFLGVTLVGKELERGTTALAWSIAPSRRAWLVGRVVPVAVLVTVACLAAGLLADRLLQAREPMTDPARTFENLGFRGVVVAADGLAAFGIALAVGAWLGRVLPALLLSGAILIGGFVGTTLLMDAFMRTETVTVVSGTLGQDQTMWGLGRVIQTRIRTPDGAVMAWGDAFEQYGEAMDPGTPGYDSRFRDVYVINPGALYPIAEARMTVIFSAIGFIGITLAFAVVERRRPS